MVNIRIHRPRTRSELTVLNDCEPPFTCATARNLPCVGLTDPRDSGIWSICNLKIPVKFLHGVSMSVCGSKGRLDW